jgi:hypothetical protein
MQNTDSIAMKIAARTMYYYEKRKLYECINFSYA